MSLAVRPRLAFTMGDPSGIGPEIVLAAAQALKVRRACRPLLIGSRQAFYRRGWRPSLAPLLDTGAPCPSRPGRPTPEGGAASFAAVRLALELAVRDLADAVVTAPIAKESWSHAGVRWRDHTDYLQAVLGARDCGMLLIAGRLRAVLATRHLPLREAARRLTTDAVVTAARVLRAALRELGIPLPRLGLCALNPHAGEGGLLGDEERRVLAPAVRRLSREGLDLVGPLSADAAWADHAAGRYDGLVALYHDQALVPLKLSAPYGVVNWTAGLSVVRTSPGHGTAFDIAGKGKADPSAMVEAALLAARLAVLRSRGIGPRRGARLRGGGIDPRAGIST